MSNIQIAR